MTASNNPYAPPATDLTGQPARAAASMEPVSISFELGEEDVVAFHRDHLRRAGGRRRRVIFVVAGCFLLASAVFNAAAGGLSSWMVAAAVLGTILLAMGLWLGSGWQLRRSVATLRKSGSGVGTLGRWTLTADDGGVAYTSPTTEARHRWSAFERVVVGEDTILLYTTPLTALLLPRHAFPSSSAAAELGHAADERIRAARVERGLPETPAPAAKRRSVRALVLWVILVLLFFVIYYVLAGGGATP